MGAIIKSIQAREILDSRGNPTVAVEIALDNGVRGWESVPSGASTGTHEAIELRDKDPKRFGGKGVLKAVKNVNTIIAPALKGKDVTTQRELDEIMCELDGTENKGNLGANAICGVSLALARTAAKSCGLHLYEYLSKTESYTLPVPMINIINGGIHTLMQGPDFQEYMIVPHGAKNIKEAMRWASETYHALKKLLKDKGLSISVADEGGFVPTINSNKEPINLIINAIEKAGYIPGEHISIALDIAASCFFIKGKYLLRIEHEELAAEEMIDYYINLIDNYPIILIEDGLSEDDWDGWKRLNEKLGQEIELVGDDLFVTNVKRIKQGIDEDVANSVLIKINQIGTVTETIAAITLAKQNKWGFVVSHRSGETVSSFISDFSVAMGGGKLKTGAPCRGERVEKYNQLIRIEEEQKGKSVYAGKDAFVR
ncbi:MAG: phosphopyruvate hydratase [Candidatus Cloacimonadota bacterium]|nr:MAG: phosphopyruvate hydratase [Candidatus Cloacimonadota bacterium]